MNCTLHNSYNVYTLPELKSTKHFGLNHLIAAEARTSENRNKICLKFEGNMYIE